MSGPDWFRRHRAASLLLLAFAALVLLRLRRGAQFLKPQVWDEDGTIIVADFLREGLGGFLLPVHDYYVTVSKIVSWLALQVSFVQYPAISTWLTVAGTIAIVLAVATAPTLLRGRWLCALLVLLVPTNSEVFAIPLYLFWWSAILLFLLCLWDPERPRTALRAGLAALAGMSSPAIFLAMPVLAARVLVFRARWREEAAVTAVAGVAAAIQLGTVVSQGIVGGKFPLLSFLQNVVPKYFGFFAVGHWLPQPAVLWAGGVAVLAVLALWTWREPRRFVAAVLLYLVFAAIAIASLRIDPVHAHPDTIGPRYFFFPYLLLFWALVQLLVAAPARWQQAAAGLAISAAVVNALPVFSRPHVDLRWADHVLSCLEFDRYRIPVQYDGTGMGLWYLPVTRETCARLLEKDPFRAAAEARGAALLPYRVAKGVETERPLGRLLKDDMHGADFARTALPGRVVVGSFVQSDADLGSATFRLRRGESLMYRSGPRSAGQRLFIVGAEQRFASNLPVSLEWVTLDFSNRQLPEEFTVRVSDESGSYGEWSAFAARPRAP